MKKEVTKVLLSALIITCLLPSNVYAKKKKIDIIVFAGQSNMMGHGNASQAPTVSKKNGLAYLPVSAPGKLSTLYEPFGREENDSYFNNVFAGENYATGSMVSSFVNAYYAKAKTPVLAVPAAMMGTGSSSWATSRYKGIISRTNAAKKAAKKAGYTVDNTYLVWLQGESDALAMQRNADGSCDSNMSEKTHIKNVKRMYDNVAKKTDVSACFVIVIPSYYGPETDPYGVKWSTYYKKIQDAQVKLCKTYDEDFFMAYKKTPSIPNSYFHSDHMHLTQEGLNKVGAAAGKAVGSYTKSNR